MNKYYGKIGFGETIETKPGVWELAITAIKPYYGEIFRQSKSYRTIGDKLNDDVEVSNQISILSDPYIMNHLKNIRYIEWLGSEWKITNIDIQYPRLVLTIGGEYNGPTTITT